MFVDNIIESNNWDEIVVGVAGSDQNLKLLNASGHQIWNYSISASITAVSAGNLSFNAGKEIVAASSERILYLLNSSGHLLASKTMGDDIKEIEVSNINETNLFDEIVIASDKVYLLNHTLNEMWSYSTGLSFKGVGVGELATSTGKEIVAVTSGDVFILNASGSVIATKNIGNLNDVDVDNADNTGYDEIALATTNGTVYLLDSSLNVLWSYSIGYNMINKIKIEEVTTEYEGKEIVFGSVDDYLYVLSRNGVLVWKYKTENDVKGISIGNLTADMGNEVVAGTIIPATNTLHILNFEYFPTNPYLDIGSDSQIEWSYTGKFRSQAEISNNSAFQSYLNSCQQDDRGACSVPLLFYSSFPGILKISSINITYTYNISNIFSIETISSWSRIKNIKANESVGNQIRNITYLFNPFHKIGFKYITVNPAATVCDFNGSSYPTALINGKKVCNISLNQRLLPVVGELGYDYVLDDTMSKAVAIYYNETQGISQGGFWKKNVTVWNATTTIFFNITVNTTLDESYITGNTKIKVDWFNNGTLFDITPSNTQNDCNSNNPTYTSIILENYTFYVCKQDTNSDGRVDFFIWKQPNSNKTHTVYEISGSANNPPQISNISFSPAEDFWGKNFTLKFNISDTEGNNISAMVCLNLTRTFNLSTINLSSIVWNCFAEKNSTGNTITGEEMAFLLESNKTWTGNNLLAIYLRDFDENTEYHDWFLSSIYYWPNVTKHTTQVILATDKNSVNRTETILLSVLINDTIINQNVSNVRCRLWTSINDTHWLHYDTFSNSSGYCNYQFTPNSSYLPGLRWWKAGVYDDNYYNDSLSENFTLHIYGKININLTEDSVGNITRNKQKILKAKIFDEFGQTINQPGYQCLFTFNQTSLGINQTSASGICLLRVQPDCYNELGKYNLTVALSGNPNNYYIYSKASDEKYVYLKEQLNTSIISPYPNSIYHKGELMNLSFSALGSCGIPEQSYNSLWKLNCTTHGYPPYSTTISATNTTWQVECNPGILLISLTTSGELYETSLVSRSIDIYGWSKVSMLQPLNGTYNRTETERKIDIVCEVTDANTTTIKLDGYKVDIVKIYEGNSTVIASLNTLYPTGRVNYTWNISSAEQVPEGWYRILCNITSQSLDAYRKYNASTPIDFADILIIEKDTMPPKINKLTINSTILNGNTVLQANITDWYGVDAVWAKVSYPNGTKYDIKLFNTTPDKRQTIWEANFTNMKTLGDYDIVVYANDTSNFTSNATTWFEVYLPIQLYAETTYPKRFTFYRPGSSLIVHNYTYPSGWHNLTLHRRTYDLKVEINDDINQNHFIIFNDLNTTLTSQKQFGEVSNITNPLNISIIPLALLNPPVPWRHEIGGIYLSTNFAFSNLTVYFDYSKKVNEIDYAPAIVIYKCNEWNGSCSSGWVQVDTILDAENQKVYTIQTNASAYYAFEAEICGNKICGTGESCLNCVADCGECGSGLTNNQLSSAGGGGGGGERYRSYCGNGICDEDENPFSCPQDCISTFSVKTNLTTDYVSPATKRTYAVWVLNMLTQPIQVNIMTSGPASSLLNVREKAVNVLPQKEKEIIIDLNLPDNIEAGTYTGEIIVSSINRKERLPFTIFVTKQPYELQLLVKTITKTLKPNETLAFELNIFSLTHKKEFVSEISYTIKSLKGDSIIYHKRELVEVKTPYHSIKYIHLPENISAGKYYIIVNATYDKEILSSLDSFEITLGLITAKTIRYVLIASVAVATVILSIVVFRKYIAWRKAKLRYIFPVDFSLLPRGDLAIGKIAETNIKAFFNSNDLTTHILVAGATGAGKSVTASILAEELLEKKIPVVVFDPTAQWTGFVKPCKDENVLKYYKMHNMTIDDAKSYPGNIYEMTDPKTKIDFKKYMNPGEITVFVLNKLKPGEYDEAVTNIINSIFSQPWEESTTPKLIIVFDEVHRLLEKYGGKGGYVALERACREFRKWGIGLIMVSQVLSDFKEAIKGNVLTEIQMHTKSLSDLQRIEKKYGLEYARRVAKEEVGIGMVQHPKYNKGLPWFVSFRPPMHMPHKITEQELQMYKDYNLRIEKIEKEIERLEKEGRDVFDLKIELKLAKDKLKKGMFRVSEIYIESLNKKLGLVK
ncbi:MAG: DUF853 family protein [Candidatus Aenigmarchaeota archaeon]|nr:DUF853 family protein [Candidatus Aenigmarchaeota archaeon]